MNEPELDGLRPRVLFGMANAMETDVNELVVKADE